MKITPMPGKVMVKPVGWQQAELEEAIDGWAQRNAPPMEGCIQPMHDRVLVERLPQPETIGRIIIPEVARAVAVKCKVIAVGPGRWEDGVFTKTAVKPGDVVLVPGCGNTHPDWQAGQQILIQSADIGAILG